jgi:hypothetical protein
VFENNYARYGKYYLSSLPTYVPRSDMYESTVSKRGKEREKDDGSKETKHGEGELNPSACSSIGEMWGAPGEMRLKIGRIQRVVQFSQDMTY